MVWLGRLTWDDKNETHTQLTDAPFPISETFFSSSSRLSSTGSATCPSIHPYIEPTAHPSFASFSRTPTALLCASIPPRHQQQRPPCSFRRSAASAMAIDHESPFKELRLKNRRIMVIHSLPLLSFFLTAAMSCHFSSFSCGCSFLFASSAPLSGGTGEMNESVFLIRRRLWSFVTVGLGHWVSCISVVWG